MDCVNHYSMHEVAEKMGVNYNMIRKLVKECKIPFHRIGEKKIYFTDDDVNRLDDCFKVTPSPFSKIETW